jgi:hypothetical protein
MPREMYDEIGRLASAEDRSMNNWMVRALRAHLATLKEPASGQSR